MWSTSQIVYTSELGKVAEKLRKNPEISKIDLELWNFYHL